MLPFKFSRANIIKDAKKIVAFSFLCFVYSNASAQFQPMAPLGNEMSLRAIPKESRLTTVRFEEPGSAVVDGKKVLLSPALIIRNENNFIVTSLLSTALGDGVPARVLIDQHGMLSRVWLLTPREAQR